MYDTNRFSSTVIITYAGISICYNNYNISSVLMTGKASLSKPGINIRGREVTKHCQSLWRKPSLWWQRVSRYDNCTISKAVNHASKLAIGGNHSVYVLSAFDSVIWGFGAFVSIQLCTVFLSVRNKYSHVFVRLFLHTSFNYRVHFIWEWRWRRY